MTDSDQLRLEALEDENRRLRAALALQNSRLAEDAQFLLMSHEDALRDLSRPNG